MTIDIEKLAKENGFIPHEADDGECYADIKTLKQLCEAYAAKVLEDKEREIAELKEQLEDETKWASHYATQFHNAQSHINDLREALEDIAKHTPENFWQNKAAQQALSKTAPQCLQEHDNEVIEKCALACEKVDETTVECPELAIYCAEAIRALKVSND